MLLSCITISARQDDSAVASYRVKIWELWDRSVFHGAVEELLTGERRGELETGIPSQEQGKKKRSQEILYWKDEVMGLSVRSSQEEPGRIQEFHAHGTVPCRAEENMPVFNA